MAAAVSMRGISTASEYRAGLALAEAIIPGSATVPAADEAHVRARARRSCATSTPPSCTAWRLALRALDAAAVAYTGSPFHALSARKQEELVARWQVDPVLKAPLGLRRARLQVRALRSRRRLRHDGRQAQRRHARSSSRGGSRRCTAPTTGARATSSATSSWSGTGAGGGVVGRELAERGYAVVFVEEGEHHRRDAFDGSAVHAHQRFYRGAFSVGNAPMPIFMGRLVGGSTAINGGTCFRTPAWVLERWCEEIGTDEFSPRGDDAPLRAGRALPRGGAVAARHHRPHRRLRGARLRRARLEPLRRPAQRPRLRRQGLLRLRLPHRRAPRDEPVVRPGGARQGRAPAHRARASSSVVLDEGRRARGVEAVTRARQEAPRAGARRHPRRGRGADAAAPAQAGARQPQRPGGRTSACTRARATPRSPRSRCAAPGTSRRATAATSSCATAS